MNGIRETASFFNLKSFSLSFILTVIFFISIRFIKKIHVVSFKITKCSYIFDNILYITLSESPSFYACYRNM